MDPKHLPGSLKVAILIQSLDKDAAQQILDSLEAGERELVARHLSQMGAISPELADRVAEEFAELVSRIQSSPQPLPAGNPEGARKEGGNGGNTPENLGNLQAIETMSPEQVADMLKDEHPQTIAIVLAHVSAGLAGEVFGCLQDEVRRDVALRIARTEKFLSAMVEEIDRVLGELMQSKDQGGAHNISGVDRLAEILNMMEGTVSEALMNELEESDPDMVAQIKQRMFVFEDVVLVDDRGLQKLLRRVESKELAVALKVASEEVKNKIFKNMSERAGEMVREEIEGMGPVRMKEVENAQQMITRIIQELEEKGELVISGRRGEKIVG